MKWNICNPKPRALTLALALASFLLALPTTAHAQSPGAICNHSAILTTTSSGPQQMIAAPTATQQVHICAVFFAVSQGSSVSTFGLVSGTGTNCGTGQANVTPQWPGGAASAVQYWYQNPGPSAAMNVPYGNAVCLNLSAAPTTASVQILYSLY